MENWLVVYVSRLLIALAICMIFVSWSFSSLRGSHDFPLAEGCDCRHQCSWQLTLMNETFNTLIAVCEEKLRKLHDSDMNMAIIREQLHKEILEQFRYELQTFPRFHPIESSVPQFCSEYCAAVGLAKHKEECKENVTKLHSLHYENRQLLKRQRWLQLQLQRRLQQTGMNTKVVDADNVFWSTHLWAMATVIVLIAFAVMIILGLIRVCQHTKDRLVAMETEKEKLEVQMYSLTECNISLANDAQLLKSNLDAQQLLAKELLSDSDNRCMELAAWNKELLDEAGALREQQQKEQESLLERNSLLAAWNDELLTEQQRFESKEAKLCLQIDRLAQKCEEEVKKLSLRDTELRNAHKFWHKLQSEERKVRQALEAKQEYVVSTLEKEGLKYQWELAREVKRYQNIVNELETKLKHANERDAEGQQILVKKQEEQEATVRKLKQDKTVLMMELERSKMTCDMERERKNRALAQVSGLESEVKALKVQTVRLEERFQAKKSYKTSRPFSSSQRQAQSSQTSSSLQHLDSRLEDMQRDFETRFTLLQSRFDNQLTRDSEELQILRTEHEELCKRLELANKRNTQLERRLAYQEPIQPNRHTRQHNKGSDHTRRWSRTRLRRQRSSSTELRDDSFLTQPESTYVSANHNHDLTDYRLSSIC